MTAKPSDILNRAAEIMIERGHGKFRYVNDVDGHVCVQGAVLQAMNPFEEADFYYQTSEFLKRVVAASPIEWNDRPETTEAMAIGALHEAALLAKEAGE